MLQVLPPQLSSAEKLHKLQQILNGLILSEQQIERIRNVFINEMELALNMQSSSLQMENTYIPELPDGTENGVFLAMDLGGTNLRIILLTLRNGCVDQEIVEYFDLPESLRIGCGDALFDYLAVCVNRFAIDQQLSDDITYPLGFTFSFPMQQNGLDSGILVTWTKSFNCPSVVGADAVQLLRNALGKIQRKNIKVVAILNDTTGTLMHGALLDRNTRIGIVLGTGSNACYMENANCIKHWEQARSNEQHVVIDIEWGAFGDNGVLDFIKTDFDWILDNSSLLKNSFTFEKYIGGKYLGELCRIILQELHEQGLFLLSSSASFPKAWQFGSDNVSFIERDTMQQSNVETSTILSTHFQAGQPNVHEDDLHILRYVCALISQRAAQLVAINTAVLLNRMHDQTDITVAIDGSVYKHHARLRHWLEQLTQLWAPSKNCKFILAEDGSGKGAALVAAIAEKLREHSSK